MNLIGGLPVTIDALNEESAREISSWKYEEPYDLYSHDGSPALINELLNGSYYGARVNESLIGYYCYGESAQVPAGKKEGFYGGTALDIGLGLRPNLTGKGFGTSFLSRGMEFGSTTFQPDRFRLTVAAFNQRAVIVYQRLGFTIQGAFMNNNIEFIVMTCPLRDTEEINEK
ncbi:GNAT family N-acetyltransferase [Sediminibacillus halophilus]|uniref:Acetyltransferase (GNAT) domain-containing protein n=1 Tax=Sediminibacillus halophilus TaxID=482461 RepID=A0A1G9N2H5_9BACI|nr:GNAT family N-acetyltransferase [Sediminibacillus halophilus]SDL80583.1 Acetyltransferase (GNAT) domain-containing protein [Sediminibacillus halophilus]